MTSALPDLRWPRAVLLAVVVVSFGSVAHAEADGLLPPWPMMLVIVAVTALISGAFLDGPASNRRIVLLAVVGQGAVHSVLTMTSGHVGDPARSASRSAPPAADLTNLASQGGGSLSGQYAAATSQSTDAGLAIPAGALHLIEHATGPQAPMMALHVIAAFLVGLWLSVGERALWALVALSVALVLPLFVRVLASGRPASLRPFAATGRTQLPPPLAVLTRGVSRRGPPVLLAG